MGSSWRESGVLELLIAIQSIFIFFVFYFLVQIYGPIIYSIVNDHLGIYHHLIVVCLKAA